MRIVLITNITPASENIRGTSALPYHLMLKRDPGIEIIIYSFNLNNLSNEKKKEVEDELHVQIRLLSVPKWFTIVFKFHLLWVRVFLKYPLHNYLKLSKKIVEEIHGYIPDGIWVYGEEMSMISKQFPHYNRVHTLPDAESLYYYRMIRKEFVVKNDKWFRILLLMMPKFMRMERDFDNSINIHYHLVGEEDVKMLKSLNPNIQAHFIRHPHYDLCPQEKIMFGDKMRILLAGKNNVYMEYGAAEVIKCFELNIELKNYYEITFLGKGWENALKTLQDKGYDVRHINFVENYIEEIVKYDIQITPINIGTGTKGKVLDALANGLLVIGTLYAMENIMVQHGKSCLIYSNNNELFSILKDIPINKVKYENIAKNGRTSVLNNHSRKDAASELFSLFLK